MQEVLIFDVDGTLTGPRRVMHDDFSRFFRTIVTSFPVYLVTGSDLPKLDEQIPDWILRDVAGSFTCSGNEFWQNGRLQYRNEHDFAEELTATLNQLLLQSPYPRRTGNHIEARVGTLNFSVVGRNASPGDRADYREYDIKTSERVDLQNFINDKFPEYEANCGGQISIDISLAGRNKSQIVPKLRALHPHEQFHFFGDNIKPGGNDYPLALAIKDLGPGHNAYPVSDHFETWRILQKSFA